MSLRELIVLGTASQVPTRHRNHNGYLLRWDGEGFLFDPGEGTQRQFLFAGVAASAVTRIFVTHFHGDHCLGLASMVQRLSLDGVRHAVEVFYPASGQVYYERLIDASIYHKQVTLVPRPLPLTGATLRLSDTLSLEALPLDHVVDCLGYRIVEDDELRFLPERLKALGLAGPKVGELQTRGEIEHGGRRVTRAEVSESQPGASFAFVMDTRKCANAVRLGRDVSMLVCESTFAESEREQAEGYGHLTAGEAASIALESGASRLVLTHFSARYADVAPLLEEARAIFPAAEAARDLARFAFERPGRSAQLPDR